MLPKQGEQGPSNGISLALLILNGPLKTTDSVNLRLPQPAGNHTEG